MILMKKTHLLLPLLALVFVLPSCTPQDQFDPSDVKYYVEELATWDFTVGEGLNTLLNYVGMDPSDPTLAKITGYLKKSLDKRLRAVAISYHTVDPFGKPVVASGAFFYPLDSKPAGVMEVPPIAHMDRFHGASISVSNKSFFEECTPALLSYITLTPDMIGSNLTGDYLRAYLHSKNTGEVCYHFRLAVNEYLRLNSDIRMPEESSIIGYSLGGSSALSIARYYKENHTGIKVKDVYTGGGVYDAVTAFREYAKWGKCNYPAIPCVIISMDKYYNLGLDYTKIFTGGMERPENNPDASQNGDGYGYWFDNTHKSQRIAERWGSDLHAYMHPDFFNEELTGEFAKLKDCLMENSEVYGFEPNPLTNIKLFHSTEDNLIPNECAVLLNKVYRANGAAISYTPTTGDHYEAGARFLVTVLAYLLLN